MMNNNLLTSLISVINEATGLNFKNRESFLASKIESFSRKKDIQPDLLLSKTLNQKSLFEEFIDFITVNETYFFREVDQLKNAIQALLKIPGPHDVLVIPCSSGEEVFTILILYIEAGGKLDNINITGMDISPSTIEKARKAIYPERKFHKTPRKIKEKYFIKTTNGYKIKSDLIERVNFEVHNIFSLENCYLRFNLISCRNLFIYFEKNKKEKALKILSHLKKTNHAQIVLGHADMPTLKQY